MRAHVQETLSRAKAGQHRCRGSLACVDCHQTFYGQEYLAHTQCISEKEKYQGVKPQAGKSGKGSSFAAALAAAVDAKSGTVAQQAALRELMTCANLDAMPSKVFLPPTSCVIIITGAHLARYDRSASLSTFAATPSRECFTPTPLPKACLT